MVGSWKQEFGGSLRPFYGKKLAQADTGVLFLPESHWNRMSESVTRNMILAKRFCKLTKQFDTLVFLTSPVDQKKVFQFCLIELGLLTLLEIIVDKIITPISSREIRNWTEFQLPPQRLH
jgi:hypothetical protein